MTDEMLWEIECRFVEGENDAQIARAVGTTIYKVRCLREQMDYEPIGCGRPKVNLRIKSARNGRIMAQGTVEECAEKMGKSVKYVRQLERKVKIGALKKYVIEHID